MIDLHTLGALELTSAESRAVGSILAQPRRAALLCYLALAVPRGFHRRDTLFPLFWPEYDANQARHALRQSVYFLRRGLGVQTIVSRGDDELALAPGQVCCDAWAFDAAVDQGRPAEALALYRGELLAGFHISAAPDFERWLDQERGRLRQRATEAAWALAAARERDGDAAGAAEAARRAVALSPSDETALRRLILLLERLGDRVAAVRAYEAFAWTLEQEYELEPSSETRTLVARIRAESGERQAAAPGNKNGLSPALGNRSSTVGMADALYSHPLSGNGREVDWSTPSRRFSGFPRHWNGMLAAALVLVLVGTALWRARADSSSGGSVGPAAAGERVLVADFDNFTAESLMGDVVAQALRLDLASSPTVRVAGAPTVAAALRRMLRPPDSRLDRELAREVALREGIRAVISGEVRKVGAAYIVSAALVETATGDVIEGWQEAAQGSSGLLHAISRLSATARKRVGRSLPSLAPGESLYHTTTVSLEALRRYTQAKRAQKRGDFFEAADLFDEAIRLDSGFAQAYMGLAYSLGNAGAHYSRVLGAGIRAFQLRDRLPPPERYTVMANYYEGIGDLPKAIDAYRNQVETAKPNRESILYASLGSALASTGDLRGAEAVLREARQVYPTALNQATLVRVLYRLGKPREASAALEEASKRFPGHPILSLIRARIAAASGDYEAADSLAVLASRAERVYADEHRQLLALNAALRGRLQDATAGLRTIRDRLLANKRLGEAAELAVAIGRFRLARGERRAALAEVERFLAQDPPDSMHPLERPYFSLARFYAESGQPSRARRLMVAFQREVPARFQARDRGTLERSWAAIHLADGRPQLALQEVQQAAREYQNNYLGFDAPMIRVGDYPELARAYDRAGFPDSAIATYERFLAIPSLDRLTLDAFERPNALFRLAELYERRGDYAAASDRYFRLVDLWKDADPALQPRVELARRRAAVLAARP